MIKTIFAILAAASITAPALADPIKDDEFFTPHAQGCMLLQECTDHVQELKTVSDLNKHEELADICLLYTSPSPRDRTRSRMPSSA